MDKLKTTHDMVRKLLENEPKTRNSDSYLYVRVCQALDSNVDLMPFSGVMLNLKKLGLPGFETVRRSRQKIQHEFPELSACDDVEAARELNEEAFREYAMG